MDSLIPSINTAATRGVTLIELVIVLAIAGILLASVQPSYHILGQETGGVTAVAQYAQALQRAQLLSESVRGDSQWGVALVSTSTILFKGSTFAGRDASYDEVYSFSVPVTVGGATQIIFSKVFGTTTPATSTLAVAGITKSVVVDAKGAVSY